MAYVSAKYVTIDPHDPTPPLPDEGKQVMAFDENGQLYALRDNSQEGDWLRYIDGGGTIDPADPYVVTSEVVNRERDRRVTGGFDYMGHRFQSDEFSQRNIMDAAQAANLAIADGVRDDELQWQLGATEDYYWLDVDNVKVPMTAYDVRGLAQNMQRFKQRMVRNGRDLKDMDPIPLDYQDDSYWPFTPPPEIPI